jgi:predicted nucleotidyltransferase
MVEVSAELLEQMTRAIVREVAPEQVILFGSRSRGAAAPDADVDLLVVEREPFGPQRSRRAELSRIRRALSPFRVPKDILVFSADEAARWRGSVNHILARVLREGHPLYERS